MGHQRHRPAGNRLTQGSERHPAELAEHEDPSRNPLTTPLGANASPLNSDATEALDLAPAP